MFWAWRQPSAARGQTLLELLVVISIIVIVMTMLLVMLAKIYRAVMDMKGG